MKKFSYGFNARFFFTSIVYSILLSYAKLTCMPTTQPNLNIPIQTSVVDEKPPSVPLTIPAVTPTPQQQAVPKIELSQSSFTQKSQGLETVNIPNEKIGIQGNWIKKKDWLLKTHELSSNIYNLTIQIEGTRKIFQEKYNSIDAELDKFYKDLGMEQGKLQELFDSIERYLEKKKKKDITVLTEEAEKPDLAYRDFRTKIELLENQITGMKNDLTQLKLDMKSIEDIDKSLTQRLQKVDEQITTAITQADAAKNKVEVLWDIIDDKKARLIYYEVLNIEEKLKSILTYLKNTLAGDFDNVIQTTKSQIANITSAIKKLESNGIIIKDRVHRVEQLKIAELKKLELEAKEKIEKEQKKVTPTKEKDFVFLRGIYNFFVNLPTVINKFIKDIFAKPKPTETTKSNLQQTPKPLPSPSLTQPTINTQIPETIPSTIPPVQ